MYLNFQFSTFNFFWVILHLNFLLNQLYMGLQVVFLIYNFVAEKNENMAVFLPIIIATPIRSSAFADQ